MRIPAEVLLEAFIKTAREYEGTPTQLALYGDAAVGLASQGLLGFRVDEVADFMARMREAGYPAVHHSAAFEAEYQPAYRVLALHLLPPEIISAA